MIEHFYVIFEHGHIAADLVYFLKNLKNAKYICPTVRARSKCLIFQKKPETLKINIILQNLQISSFYYESPKRKFKIKIVCHFSFASKMGKLFWPVPAFSEKSLHPTIQPY